MRHGLERSSDDILRIRRRGAETDDATFGK